MSVRVWFAAFAALLLSACSAEYIPYADAPTQSEIDRAGRGLLTAEETALFETMRAALIAGDAEAANALYADLILIPAPPEEEEPRDAAPATAEPEAPPPPVLSDVLPGGEPVRILLRDPFARPLWDREGEAGRIAGARWLIDYGEAGVAVLDLSARTIGEGEPRLSFARLRAQPAAAFRPPVEGVPTHGLAAALSVIIPGFIILLFLACLLANRMKRKWVWLPLILVTWPTLSFNWSSAEFALIAPVISQQDGLWDLYLGEWVLGGVAVRQAAEMSPMTLIIGIPVGALFFLFSALGSGLERKPD